MAFGKKVDALRKRYQDYLWKGVFRHILGAKVTSAGKNYDTYSVFENRKNSKRAVVVDNYDYDRSIDVEVELEGKAGDLWRVTPEDPEPEKYMGHMIVSANSVVIFIEK